MTLTIDLPDDLAKELGREATRRGMEPAPFAMQILRENLSAAERSRSLRALFEQWAAEDATDDPVELARRQQEWEELKKALNENRTSGRKLFGT
jgi:PleD family two-component response regulator